jgi:hypothetical protein
LNFKEQWKDSGQMLLKLPVGETADTGLDRIQGQILALAKSREKLGLLGWLV